MSNWAEVVDCLEEIKEHILTTIEQYGYQQEAIGDLIYMRDAIDKTLFDKDGKPRHAPVMDAEALADKLIDAKLINEEKITYAKWDDDLNRYKFPIDRSPITKIITDSRDLKLDWKDGGCEYGELFCSVFEQGKPHRWVWMMQMGDGTMIKKGNKDTQESAIKACEQALRFIVCGVKS